MRREIGVPKIIVKCLSSSTQVKQNELCWVPKFISERLLNGFEYYYVNIGVSDLFPQRKFFEPMLVLKVS